MVRLRTTLQPAPPPVPLVEIVQAWTEQRFAPAACRAELERLVQRYDVPRELFDPAAIDRGARPATDELLFGWYARPRPWRWIIMASSGAVIHEVPAELVPSIAELIRLAAQSASVDAFRADAVELGHDEEIIEQLAASASDGRAHGVWPAIDADGIYRREHASLAIAVGDTRIVTDPQALMWGWTTANGAYPEDGAPLGGARVLITHSHDDHWDLASTLHATAPDDAVVVPRVPAPSLLARDMAAELALAEQAVLAPAWHERLRIGDVDVEVLPFYGEQPTRDLPLPHPARNWGNCYRFDAPGWSAAILVDSGRDAAGTMAQAIARSVAERGPIDLVLSCCYEFPEAINLGLPGYLLTLPFDDVRRYAQERGSMTSGPTGLAEICEAAQARWFAPYAHGFSGLGQSPRSNEGSMSESAIVAEVAGALSARGVATEIVAWTPGDRIEWRDRRPHVRR